MLRLILEQPQLFTAEYFLGHSRFLEEFLVRLHLFALRASKRRPQVFRDAIRNRKLKRLLSVAANIPFWKGKIGNEILNAEEPLSLLHYLPIITKEDLRSTPIEERTNQNLAAKYGILSYTSGSTGEPLQFFVDRRLQCRHWALVLYVGGVRMVSRQSLIHLWPTLNPNFSFPNHFYAKTIEELQAQKQKIYSLISKPNSVVFGFPSLLRSLIDFAQQDSVILRPHTIISAGEVLASETRLLFQDRFGCRVVDHYGCREISVMAGQCDNGRFHENSEDVIFEVVSENGELLKPGETGKLVVTGLNSHIAPFIRYHIGDYGFFYEDHCPCGNSLPAFNFEGRTHDVTPILLPDGSHIFPYALTGIFNRKFKKIRQYQINHRAPHSFVVYIVPAEKLNRSNELEILADFKRVTKNSQVRLQFVTSIESKGLKVLPYVKSF